MFPKGIVPYQKDPENRIYHVREFIYEILGKEAWSRYFLELGLVHVVFNSRQVELEALLPPGWAVTQVLVHVSHNRAQYQNDWGYATFVGPLARIEELAVAEKARHAAAQEVARLYGGLKWHGNITSHEIGTSGFAGEVILPNRTYQPEPVT